LPLTALRRELHEETGLVIDADPPHVWHQEVTAPGQADGYDGEVNDYFLVRTPGFDPRGALSDDELARRAHRRDAMVATRRHRQIRRHRDVVAAEVNFQLLGCEDPGTGLGAERPVCGVVDGLLLGRQLRPPLLIP
jgi:8-oxo-dGTP pyrophosphatase MutT (NUDIX family)